MISAQDFRERAIPNPTEQHLTLVVFTTYVLFAVFVYQFHVLIWKEPGIMFLLMPGSLLGVIVHECLHAVLNIVDGDYIIDLRADKPSRFRWGGGMTRFMPKGRSFKALQSSMGYLGSSAFCSLLVFSGFDILASKIMAFTLIPFGIMTLLWANRQNGTTPYWAVAAVAITIIPFWWIDHGRGLRFWILWLGTSAVLFDLQLNWTTLVATEDPASDVHDFVGIVGGRAKVWARIWWCFEVLFLAAAVFSGILLFKDTRAEQIRRASVFLPT